MLNKKIISGFLGVLLVFFLLVDFTACNNKKLKDGTFQYFVKLEGGSGKSGINSPAEVTIRQGRAEATVVWSSSNYDYMIVDDQKYLNQNKTGNSTFTFPVKNLNEVLTVKADTTAMGTPHEIEYKITFSETDFEKSDYIAVSTDSEKNKYKTKGTDSPEALRLRYANQFSVVPYEKDKDCRLISIVNGDDYLLVPENHSVPAGLEKNVFVLQQPLNKTYIVSSPVMDLITKIGAVENIKYSGTKKTDWYIPSVIEAMDKGKIVYAGKYSAPDYELLYSDGCNFTIENAMILHAPEVFEKLRELGIPVLVERSSYETHPLGRIEWIKLYGLLFNREKEADEYFTNLIENIEPIIQRPSKDVKAAFFYVGSTGLINVRMPEDYIAKMISLAGGKYILDEYLKDVKASSTTNMQMEDFYLAAKDSDILIYNYTLLKDVTSIDDLIGKNPLFADFKAVMNGKVYSTDKTFFQLPTVIPDFIEDLSEVMNGNDEHLKYVRKMR